jgi:hypothetical protein
MMLDEPVADLSTEWRMRLTLAVSMLKPADLVLLGEPTNHLGEQSVEWPGDYVNSIQNSPVMVISHEPRFRNKRRGRCDRREGERPPWPLGASGSDAARHEEDFVPYNKWLFPTMLRASTATRVNTRMPALSLRRCSWLASAIFAPTSCSPPSRVSMPRRCGDWRSRVTSFSGGSVCTGTRATLQNLMEGKKVATACSAG